ncbi:hypothetical protein OIE90_33450 (plasmid) [Streptomyces cellulosae]|uniref:hypothetical protein n=1 Tax=Streptomyces cellulosae TaxID=1968 RepID=UPI002ED01B9E|nr:hypothetical protein OG880_33070 [Streptomyces cellulosae]WTB73723.1 hypothetical protein OIE90_33450 [Streptomyces cellulosae]
MSVEIELVGGSADGRRLAVPGAPFDPPPDIKVAELLPGALHAHRDDADRPAYQVVRYDRDRTPVDHTDGPLWHYRRAPHTT